MKHGDVVSSDFTWALLEPLMPTTSASLPLVLLYFCAEPISNLGGGDIVVVHLGGPIARVKFGVRLNQGHLLEPKRSSMGGLGFIECIVYNISSGDKGVWDVKHFNEYASKLLCSRISDKS
jgi:hypothetical protein